ncbi:MAG: T9SS C-terminal target domain-containing protein [Ignavibacteriales bacterium]|nr:MAG: T9SS C-terminal target domain-containing protein [Ignavibacteriales bacterium]
MKKILLSILIFVLTINLNSQTNLPKRELRGVWVASLGIDWPPRVGNSQSDVDYQRQSIKELFDFHKSINLNAIFFHVRPHCDAIYKSNYEPWSQYLTGSQGLAPADTSYDPLQVAIEEAHERGMELHAWLNPYRALLSGGNVGSVSSKHVIKTHPEWILKCNGSEYRFLDPGNPRVREYLVKIIMDIVRRYDVDGIHFDDYFYPYSDYGTFNDDASYAAYKYGFTSKANWRKNNVNLLCKMINDSIKVVKPWVKFGISPSGNPSVNVGIYCDPAAWLKGSYTDTLGVAHTGTPYIDYILPQLYWVQYNNQLPNWNNVSFLNGRHLLIGHAAYRYTESSFPKTELNWEINKNRQYPATIQGSVYFSSKSLTGNLAGCADTLKNNFYRYPSLNPIMNWQDTLAPNKPNNFSFGKLNSTGINALLWDKPFVSADGDTAKFYVIYRLNKSTITDEDIDNPANIEFVTSNKYYIPEVSDKGNYFYVTALDFNNNESEPTTSVEISIPAVPELSLPADDDESQKDTVVIRWKSSTNAGKYYVMFSGDSLFTSPILNNVTTQDTFILITGLAGQQKYYWKVKAENAAGTSDYSETFNFKTAFPVAPTLADPVHASTNVNRNVTFKWFNDPNASTYRIQIASSMTISPSTLLMDSSKITDTTITFLNFAATKNYFWRIGSQNEFGSSLWSTTWGFKTGTSVNVEYQQGLPQEFKLSQNYPNPFNPVTTISYQIPYSNLNKDNGKTFVSLVVYDMLGREVQTLVNEEQDYGYYQIKFDAGNLSSGIYIYSLRAGNFFESRKLTLLK